MAPIYWCAECGVVLPGFWEPDDQVCRTMREA